MIENNFCVYKHNTDISKCCKGKRKTAGGFIWKYANEKEVMLCLI